MGLAKLRWFAMLLRFAIKVAPLFVLNACRLLNFARCRWCLTIAFFSCGGGGHCRWRAIIVDAWWAGHRSSALTIIGIGWPPGIFRAPLVVRRVTAGIRPWITSPALW